MTSALFYGSRELKLERVPVPRPARGEVLVRVEQALTCATDLKTYIRGSHKMIPELPSPFGHEFAGVVTEIGEGVTGVEPGAAMAVANSAPCNECYFCRLERHNLCDNLRFLNGAYSEYIIVPEAIVKQNMYGIPDGVPFERMALLEPLACVVHGVERTGFRMDHIAAVIGAGPIGLMFVRLIKMTGAEVIVLGRTPWKLEAARRLGADHVINVTEERDVEGTVKDLSHGRGVDVVIEAVGFPEIWERAINITRRGGKVNLFGGCEKGTEVKIDTHALHYEEKRIISVFHHTPRYVKMAFDLLVRGELDERILITEQRPLAELALAFEKMERREALKIAIRP
ncbi:MAG: zinc-binding dehydrogenase [Candidatus Eisenbacteria bacterium]